ncbi:putative disease resistance protein RGA3 [Triticum urartu]|uniref:putative disease resistance protein RGA3 n=1 Tax=Triticum urartu TaxID=4572 RepID=UPI002043925C|nr:putative disease resistance protein RGA3 [Triticum urartu]
MVPLLIPLLGSVAAKAGDAMARRKLERHLAAVQCILLDAEDKSRTNPAIRQWIKDLKTAAYQADDVLDAFRYEVLRRRAAQIRSHSTARKVLSYFSVNSPIVFRLSMSGKMKDALKIIDELVAEMNTFHFLQNTEAPTVIHPRTNSHVDNSEIVGKEDEKELVRVMHHFELVIWVCVSNKFVIDEIIRSIIQVATMNKCDLTEMEALQKKLHEVLGKKMYLLVLDDVWNEDGQKWKDMLSLLCSDAGPGSAIIVTCRSEQVASIMGTLPTHHISLLKEDQSWELFHTNAFGRTVEKTEEIISVAKSIVHKCKGLPLAIKTIATLLHLKDHSQWFSVLDSDVWKNDILTTRIVPALQLSYDHLKSEEKICFSFCAIFPKGSIMDKDMLIHLWMANDFVPSETRGQQIFDLLVWRCFIQDGDIQNNLLSGFRDEYNEFIYMPTTYKMHDLMHDLADSVSGNDCSILQESSWQQIPQESTYVNSLQHEVRHLSLDYVHDHTIATMQKILAPRPRTILVRRGAMGKSKFISLRALKTCYIRPYLTNLKHLRYLDCSDSYVSALPEAITMLYSLQTLKLNSCEYLKKLPEGMRSMRSLRHIFLLGCHRLERMPQGRGIDQLKDLNLGGALSLFELRKVHAAENAKEGNLSTKHNLKRLSLNWEREPYSTRIQYADAKAEAILEALLPHKRLEILVLRNYTGAKLSSWMHNSTVLEHLSELTLSDCMNCKDLPPLWRLPSLVYLHNEECCLSTSPFFPKLETVEVTNMTKLERWHQEVVGQVADISFPLLKKLDISEYPMLAGMPNMLPLLEHLQVKDARDIPLHHLMNLCGQSSFECNGSIEVEPAFGWRSIGDLHFSRLGDSSVRLRLKGLMVNVEHFEKELNRCEPLRRVNSVSYLTIDNLITNSDL